MSFQTTKGKFRTNDGNTVNRGMSGGTDAGGLTKETKFSNESAFERDRIGGSPINGKIKGMDSWRKSDNLDDPGFDANGTYLEKNGIPYGEGAMFNQLPPGMDISDQKYTKIHDMKLRTYQGGVTYPGDTPWPVRDVEE